MKTIVCRLIIFCGIECIEGDVNVPPPTFLSLQLARMIKKYQQFWQFFGFSFEHFMTWKLHCLDKISKNLFAFSWYKQNKKNTYCIRNTCHEHFWHFFPDNFPKRVEAIFERKPQFSSMHLVFVIEWFYPFKHRN